MPWTVPTCRRTAPPRSHTDSRAGPVTDIRSTRTIPRAIWVGLLLTRQAGWTAEACTAPSPFTERRRWWMLAVPIVLAAKPGSADVA